MLYPGLCCTVILLMLIIDMPPVAVKVQQFAQEILSIFICCVIYYGTRLNRHFKRFLTILSNAQADSTLELENNRNMNKI